MQGRSPLIASVVSLIVLVPAVLAAGAAQPATSASAATPAGFVDRVSSALQVPAFSDVAIARLQATLDALLASEKDPARWGDDARLTLWNFVRQLQGGRLTGAQEAGIERHLAIIERAHPADAVVVDRARTMLATLTIGKTAPDIVGRDLSGDELRLSDYRGRVVLLVFSAEWCGICRTLFPYERLLQELYKNWPLTILGVDTGSSLDAAKRTRADERLTYRTWWDPPVTDGGVGPIAAEWNVQGFPSTYLLDGRGVVRFVDLRDEDLLKGVRQLLNEQVDVEARASAVSH